MAQEDGFGSGRKSLVYRRLHLSIGFEKKRCLGMKERFCWPEISLIVNQQPKLAFKVREVAK